MTESKSGSSDFDVAAARRICVPGVTSETASGYLYDACDEINRLRAANAVQRERLANAGVQHLMLSGWSGRAKAAEAKLARYREALEWYASECPFPSLAKEALAGGESEVPT